MFPTNCLTLNDPEGFSFTEPEPGSDLMKKTLWVRTKNTLIKQVFLQRHRKQWRVYNKDVLVKTGQKLNTPTVRNTGSSPREQKDS